MKFNFFLGIIILTFLHGQRISGQENWLLFTDSQSNEYFRDINGKMHVEGVYKPDRRPVSRENVEYYFNQARALIKNPDRKSKIAAIKYWNEIMLLPSLDSADYWKVKAARYLSYYKKAWGDTYTKLEKEIRYYRIENLKEKEFYLFIPEAFISLSYPSSWDHLVLRSQKERLTKLKGIIIGRNIFPLFQMVIAFDEFLHHSVFSVNDYRRLWHRRIGFKNYRRVKNKPPRKGFLSDSYEYLSPAKIVKYDFPQRTKDPETGENRLSFKKRFPAILYAGEEFFFRKKRYGYYIAYILKKNLLKQEREKFKKIIKSFKISP